MATSPIDDHRSPAIRPGVPPEDDHQHYLACVSPQMQALAADLARVAPTDLPVLIAGETGTGKSALARRVHANSRRRLAPLLVLHGATASVEAVNALAQSTGQTLLIEEVGELPVLAQRSVVRLLGASGSTPDLRFISTTSQDVGDLVERQILRTDLLHRLAVVELDIPPLRQRPDDIIFLAQHFLTLAAAALPARVDRLSSSARRRLVRHPWPGNVRELRNCIWEAVLRCPRAQLRAIDLRLPRPRPRVSPRYVQDLGQA